MSTCMNNANQTCSLGSPPGFLRCREIAPVGVTSRMGYIMLWCPTCHCKRCSPADFTPSLHNKNLAFGGSYCCRVDMPFTVKSHCVNIGFLRLACSDLKDMVTCIGNPDEELMKLAAMWKGIFKNR